MEGVLSEGMCRCCASEGSFKDFQVPYQWMGVEEIYSNMMKDCFDISLMVTEDGNNGGICEVCITQLRNAFNFKLQVQQTELKFKRKLEERSFKDSIKMELSRDGDDDSNMSGDFSSNDYEVPIKVEKVEDKPKKRQAAKASTSKAKKSKASPGETSTKRGRQLNVKNEISIKMEKSAVSKNKKQTKLAPLKIEVVPVQSILERKNIKSEENRDVRVRTLLKHGINLKAILENTNATPIRYHIGGGYVCCFCTNQYPDPADLKKHTSTSHDEKDRHIFMKKQAPHSYMLKLDITVLRCQLCEDRMETVQQMFKHLQNEHKKILYDDVIQYIVPFKFNDDQLKCAICSLVFVKFKGLQEHMNTHYRNFACDVCNAGCINRKILSRHMVTHKTGSFKCENCSKTFNSIQKMRLHDHAVHKKVNLRSKCRHCKERFTTNHLRDQHMTKVHGVPAILRKCLACERTFTSQNALRVHNKRDHLMERQHICTECSKSFYNRHELQHHMLKHTGKKDFQCDVCHKAFGRLYTLREHMRIHADDRRFKCEHCGRAFVQKCSLRGHMRAIHGDIDK